MPPSKKSFRERVLEVVRCISAGHVMTYKAVAAASENPKAYRAVGNILRGNRDPAIPCHRVVRSDGTAGGYYRGSGEKLRRLRDEGAVWRRGSEIESGHVLW